MIKKFSCFVVACVALIACNKTGQNPAGSRSEAVAFAEGEEVVFSASAPLTKVTGSLDSSTGNVDFKWEEGDVILVKIGDQTSPFTLKEGAGQSSATFQGVMPAAGNCFDVQFPASDPDLQTQTYVAGGLSHNAMKFVAEGCNIDCNIELKPVYSALRLNLYADRTIGKITVTDKTASPEKNYTLNCPGGVRNTDVNVVTIPFFIVMPEGTRNFEVNVYDAQATPSVLCTRATVSEQVFGKGKVLNMPVKCEYPGTDVDPLTISNVTFAPVNCGYVANKYVHGLYYQWGRVHGVTYDESPLPTLASSYYSGVNGEDDPSVYYKSGAPLQTLSVNNSSTTSWIKVTSTTADPQLYFWNSGTEAAPVKTDLDPCPSGWRVPTKAEMGILQNSSISVIATVDGLKGRLYYQTSGKTGRSILLPYSGKRNKNYAAAERGSAGYYYCSKFRVDGYGGSIRLTDLAYDETRAYNCNSIRCVKE